MRQFYLILALFFFTCATAVAGRPIKRVNPADYIEHYKNSALKEMFRHGIPASIILGQGMVESDCGNSELAQNANNHFGLKCHKEWRGETFNYDDDQEDECFRKYDHALDSYEDHSIFLRSRKHYDFLFKLSLTDYKAWAKGLKSAGYATHPEYAKKVIDIIERYRLYELDQYGYISIPAIGISKPKQAGISTKTKLTVLNKHESIAYNHSLFIILKEGDTYMKIAREFNLELEDLLKYNDYPQENELVDGNVLFVKPRRDRASKSYHLVTEGETMKSIAQLYAIDLHSLYKKNRMSLTAANPQPGTLIYLRKKKPAH